MHSSSSLEAKWLEARKSGRSTESGGASWGHSETRWRGTKAGRRGTIAGRRGTIMISVVSAMRMAVGGTSMTSCDRTAAPRKVENLLTSDGVFEVVIGGNSFLN